MVAELKEVLEKIEALREDEQKQIAHFLQQELLWADAFKTSQNQLALLADEALENFKKGRGAQTGAS